jgi:hypothetical protein
MKPAKSSEPNNARPTFQINCRPMDIEAARQALTGRLQAAITEIRHSGDVGQISQLLSDLRALDFIEGTKPDPESVPTQAPQTRDEYDASIQRKNAAIATREREQARKEAGE